MQIQEPVSSQVIAEIAREVVARLRAADATAAVFRCARRIRRRSRAMASLPPWMRPSTRPMRRRKKLRT